MKNVFVFFFLQDNDLHFPEALFHAARMLLENTGWQSAKLLEEEMRKSSMFHLALSTAKTILYYTPLVFFTRCLSFQKLQILGYKYL
jgi:hypothetical protein